MKSLCRLLCLITLALVQAARAQIDVSISVKNRLQILHAPITATVTITNQSGRDLVLEDTPRYQWFGFRVTQSDQSIIAARNPNYHLDPLPIKAGETLKRSVDLHSLFELDEFGTYRLQATIYLAAADQFYSSRPTYVELTEGKFIWKETVGVPDGVEGAGHQHDFTLLAHQEGEKSVLYVRVEDRTDGTVFCTTPLGRIIEGTPPQARFDSGNNLYVLQLVGQRSYQLSKISINGEFQGQTSYSAEKSRPELRKLANGTLQLVGGKKLDKFAQGTPLPPPAKISDRPPGLPAN